MISFVRMLFRSNIPHPVTLGMTTVTGTEVTVIWDESEPEAPSSSVTVIVTVNVFLSWYLLTRGNCPALLVDEGHSDRSVSPIDGCGVSICASGVCEGRSRYGVVCRSSYHAV